MTLRNLGGIAVIARNLGRYSICYSVQNKLNTGDVAQTCYIAHTTCGAKSTNTSFSLFVTKCLVPVYQQSLVQLFLIIVLFCLLFVLFDLKHVYLFLLMFNCTITGAFVMQLLLLILFV